MNVTVPAIFDSGVFRPLEPVDLADGTRVEVQVPMAAPSAELIAAPQRAAGTESLTNIDALPDETAYQFVPLLKVGTIRVRFKPARPLPPLQYSVDDSE